MSDKTIHVHSVLSTPEGVKNKCKDQEISNHKGYPEFRLKLKKFPEFVVWASRELFIKIPCNR